MAYIYHAQTFWKPNECVVFISCDMWFLLTTSHTTRHVAHTYIMWVYPCMGITVCYLEYRDYNFIFFLYHVFGWCYLEFCHCIMLHLFPYAILWGVLWLLNMVYNVSQQKQSTCYELLKVMKDFKLNQV